MERYPYGDGGSGKERQTLRLEGKVAFISSYMTGSELVIDGGMTAQ